MEEDDNSVYSTRPVFVKQWKADPGAISSELARGQTRRARLDSHAAVSPSCVPTAARVAFSDLCLMIVSGRNVSLQVPNHAQAREPELLARLRTFKPPNQLALSVRPWKIRPASVL